MGHVRHSFLAWLNINKSCLRRVIYNSVMQRREIPLK